MDSSSDSDDDCYGNIAQRLQKMKNNYTEDRIESTNLLDESLDLEETIKKAAVAAKPEAKPAEEVKEIESEEPDDDLIDQLIASSSKRVTRSVASKRPAAVASIYELPLQTRAGRRKTRSNSTPNTTLTSSNTEKDNLDSQTHQNITDSTPRGRNRGRGRKRGRNTSLFSRNTTSNIPTYSVGNTDEYPDQSDNLQLFSSKPNEVIVLEENEMEDNEELSVKVYWQSSEIVKFNIRRYQKLLQIFDYFSDNYDICIDKLLFTYNDKIIQPSDTPDSINYSIVKFIDGGAINSSVSNLFRKTDSELKDGVKLKFQCQDIKKPFETVVSKDEKLSKAMVKCAEHMDMTVEKLKFEFDGESISGRNTARELELEGGECIDVKIIRSI